MAYAPMRATVRGGNIQLLDNVYLPENTSLLVTVVDEYHASSLTLGEHLIGGLTDILQENVTIVSTPQELSKHLDSVVNLTPKVI